MRKSVLYDYTPEELQKLLDESIGYSEVLKKSGLSPHGNNHKTLKRIIDEYGLSTEKIDENREKIRGKKIKYLLMKLL